MKLFVLSYPDHEQLSKLSVSFARKNLQGVSEIIYLWDDFHTQGSVNSFNDETVVNYSSFKYTDLTDSGWIRQQFVKLQLHSLTTDKDFYILDGDTIIRNPIDLRPNKMIIQPEYYEPYFKFINDSLHLKKMNDFSFISPIVIFESEVLAALEDYSKKINGCDLIEFFIRNNYESSVLPISECEIYGTFATQVLGKEYEFIPIPYIECTPYNGNDFEELYFSTNENLVYSGSEYNLSERFWKKKEF